MTPVEVVVGACLLYVLHTLFSFVVQALTLDESAGFQMPGLRPKVQMLPKSSGSDRARNILFCAAVIFFLATTRQFVPVNMFQDTNSNLDANVRVLQSRLAAIRDLTETDRRVLDAFKVTDQSRMLYALYGPSVLAHCTFCGTGTEQDYSGLSQLNPFFWYALPTMLMPHLFHLAILGLVTSVSVGGRDANAWRKLAITVGLLFAIIEVAFVASASPSQLSREAVWWPGWYILLADPVFVFWTSRLVRYLIFTCFDLVLGGMIRLWATNQWPGQGPDTVKQSIETNSILDQSLTDLAEVAAHAGIINDTRPGSNLDQS